MSKCPKKLLLVWLMLTMSFVPLKAIEPSTLITFAPQAMQLAQTWSPHLARVMSSTGTGLLKIGTATFNIFKLPWGLLQSTLGAPFGYFGNGLQNMGEGLLAPCELVLQVILLPVRIISLGTIY